MKIAIMQPTFLPWLGYFTMIQRVDKFVFLDNVQFERRSWQSRNKIKLQNREFFISLSCEKAPQKTAIKDIKLSKEPKWKQILLKTFYHAYSKSPFSKRYYELLERALQKEYLTQCNIFLIEEFCKDFKINTPFLYASNMNLQGVKREDLLLKICKELGADFYLSPEGSKNYLQSEYSLKIFKESGIEVEYFDFIHPEYRQMGKEFIAYLSAVDFLCNEGQGAFLRDR